MMSMIQIVLLTSFALFDRTLAKFSKLTDQTQIIMLFAVKMDSLNSWRLTYHLYPTLDLFFILVGSRIVLNLVSLWIFMLLFLLNVGDDVAAREGDLLEDQEVTFHVLVVQERGFARVLFEVRDHLQV